MPTKTASISITAERLNIWDVKCEHCQQMARAIRLLFIGKTAFELCPACYRELRSAIAA